jgi:hypothetical protein
MMRSDSTSAETHSDEGRSVGAHLPQSFFLRVLFQTTTPWYVSRVNTARTVEGAQPSTDDRPSVRRLPLGDRARSWVRSLAIRFRP